MTLTVVVASLAFLVGILVGWTLNEAYHLARTGHTRTMPLLAKLAAQLDRIPSRLLRTLGVIAVLAAMLLNGVATLMTVSNGNADDARSACNSRYNEIDGVARDERSAFAVAGTAAELRWLKTLRDGISSEKITGPSLVTTIDEYRAALEATQRSRILTPYPDPDMCSPPPDVLPSVPSPHPVPSAAPSKGSNP